jgi:hypothetical protein
VLTKKKFRFVESTTTSLLITNCVVITGNVAELKNAKPKKFFPIPERSMEVEDVVVARIEIAKPLHLTPLE